MLSDYPVDAQVLNCNPDVFYRGKNWNIQKVSNEYCRNRREQTIILWFCNFQTNSVCILIIACGFLFGFSGGSIFRLYLIYRQYLLPMALRAWQMKVSNYECLCSCIRKLIYMVYRTIITIRKSVRCSSPKVYWFKSIFYWPIDYNQMSGENVIDLQNSSMLLLIGILSAFIFEGIDLIYLNILNHFFLQVWDKGSSSNWQIVYSWLFYN